MILRRPIGQYAVIGLILGLFFLVAMPVLSPVLLGLLTALVIYPFHARLRDKVRIREDLVAGFVTLLVTALFVVPVVLIGIAVTREAIAFVNDLTLEGVMKTYERALAYLPFPREVVEQNAKSIFNGLGSEATKVLTSLLGSLPAFVFAMALYIVTIYYGLVDGPRLVAFTMASMPFSLRETAAMAEITDKISRGVVLGSLLAGVAQGLVIGIAYMIFDIPGALLFATVTALLSFVPALGSGPTALGAVIYLFAQGRNGAAFVMMGVLALAATVDNVVKPWVLKGESLHPLLALVSALGGLAMFGVSGLFLGPLAAALAVVVLTVMQDQK